jgi:hypothetical protein
VAGRFQDASIVPSLLCPKLKDGRSNMVSSRALSAIRMLFMDTSNCGGKALPLKTEDFAMDRVLTGKRYDGKVPLIPD